MSNIKKMISDSSNDVIHDEAVTRHLDIHIGNLIKRLRIKSGVTQIALSKGTGVSLPQIQKYENATNRVSASRLYWFARTLRTSPNYFFDSFVSKNTKTTGLSDNQQSVFSYGDIAACDDTDGDNTDIMVRESEELLAAYFAIKDPKKRHWHLLHIKQDSLSE